MQDLSTVAPWVLWFAWILFVSAFVRHWFHVQAWRKRHGELWEGRREDKPSRIGLYLQGGIVLAFIPGAGVRPGWVRTLAALLAVVSTVLVMAALRHLGEQWRVNTVVTADHHLVTTGPYAVIRHPVYTAILGITVATALIHTPWICGAAALLLYSFGTEIRVRAEDALLELHFGPDHRWWRSRTRAWIPWVR